MPGRWLDSEIGSSKIGVDESDGASTLTVGHRDMLARRADNQFHFLCQPTSGYFEITVE
jgi:hypothetical protein